MAHTDQEPIEVLLIEDNPGDVRLVKEVFKDSRLPYHLSVAKDGAEAVSFLQRHGAYTDAPAPCLILPDLSLPKLGALEMLEEMSPQLSKNGVLAVILTKL